MDALRTWFSNAGQWATLAVFAFAGWMLLAITGGGQVLEGSSRYTFFRFLAIPVVIGLAQMVTLSVGQLNLAVGSLGGALAVVMGALMVDYGVPVLVAIPIGVAGGALVGLVTGLIVVTTRVNGFIVTLATLTILKGVQERIVGTRTISGYSPDFVTAIRWEFLDTPIVFIFALVVAAVIGVYYKSTLSGRFLLASGGNPVAARLSGISNDRAIIVAHTLSGLLIGVAAVMSVGLNSGVNKSIGGDWLLPSFAAPIIGGVALTGGAVAVLGTVFAAVIVRLVETAQAQYSLETAWVNFIVGAVMLGTVIVSTLRDERAAQRAASARLGGAP